MWNTHPYSLIDHPPRVHVITCVNKHLHVFLHISSFWTIKTNNLRTGLLKRRPIKTSPRTNLSSYQLSYHDFFQIFSKSLRAGFVPHVCQVRSNRCDLDDILESVLLFFRNLCRLNRNIVCFFPICSAPINFCLVHLVSCVLTKNMKCNRCRRQKREI